MVVAMVAAIVTPFLVRAAARGQLSSWRVQVAHHRRHSDQGDSRVLTKCCGHSEARRKQRRCCERREQSSAAAQRVAEERSPPVKSSFFCSNAPRKAPRNLPVRSRHVPQAPLEALPAQRRLRSKLCPPAAVEALPPQRCLQAERSRPCVRLLSPPLRFRLRVPTLRGCGFETRDRQATCKMAVASICDQWRKRPPPHPMDGHRPSAPLSCPGSCRAGTTAQIAQTAVAPES
mmetsp:Transcript_40089/g.105468  ORF Transcript_40089/g.105468 Transcript_40089/m.105468 type:complete len:232 (-) Transcript_40089:1899-2594(-)